jgi:acyl-CoA-binding protein
MPSKPTTTRSGAGKTAPAKPAQAKEKAGAGDLKARFEAAAKAAKQATRKPSDQTLLKLYAYYKQATEGDVSGPSPSFLDFVGRAKHDAWSKIKGMSTDEAMQNYIRQVDKLERE